MKLQFSFDMPDLEKALEHAAAMRNHVDIIEVGSLLLYKYGEAAIVAFRRQFPEKTILADMKIVDRGKEATRIGILAGQDCTQ